MSEILGREATAVSLMLACTALYIGFGYLLYQFGLSKDVIFGSPSRMTLGFSIFAVAVISWLNNYRVVSGAVAQRGERR